MAHFAETDKDGKILRVVVVNNDVITDEKGNEVEQLGKDFLKRTLGDDRIWVQTSYNKTMRGEYAGIGDKFDANKNIFVSKYIENNEMQ